MMLTNGLVSHIIKLHVFCVLIKGVTIQAITEPKKGKAWEPKRRLIPGPLLDWTAQ